MMMGSRMAEMSVAWLAGRKGDKKAIQKVEMMVVYSAATLVAY